MIGGVGGTAPCLIHGHGCSISADVDVLAAGFPCSPFSGQRPDRHGARRRVQWIFTCGNKRGLVKCFAISPYIKFPNRIYIIAIHRRAGGETSMQQAKTWMETALALVRSKNPIPLDRLLLPDSHPLVVEALDQVQVQHCQHFPFCGMREINMLTKRNTAFAWKGSVLICKNNTLRLHPWHRESLFHRQTSLRTCIVGQQGRTYPEKDA
eukprot:869392-Amphidinium_carterae.2